jgi:hypothetical protein
MPRTPARRRPAAFRAAGPAATAIAAVAALAACASTPAQHQVKYPATPNSGRTGATLAVSDTSGTRLDVTLVTVTDPASGASQYAKPASGKHFVGVKLRIQNKASSTYQNNANNETTITLTDGKTVHADYDPIAGCGNFDNGQITLKPGTSATGCVTFQVPKGQKVTQVSYANTVFPGQFAQWHTS